MSICICALLVENAYQWVFYIEEWQAGNIPIVSIDRSSRKFMVGLGAECGSMQSRTGSMISSNSEETPVTSGGQFAVVAPFQLHIGRNDL